MGIVRDTTEYRELEARDLAYGEYELFDGRVFRTRWRLAERFEGPVFPELVRVVRQRYGRPLDEETVLVNPVGSGKAPRRWLSWGREGRRLELRQLDPLDDGPVFLTLTDMAAVRRILAAGGRAALQPDNRLSWWQRLPPRPRKTPSEAEIDALVWDFDALLAGSGF